MIDIAVPRDIEPSVREIEGVTLLDMDDLQRAVDRNLSGREAEAGRARALVEADAERFDAWLGTLDVLPTVAELRERADGIVEQVLEENASRWEGLTDADRGRAGGDGERARQPPAARADAATEGGRRGGRRVRPRCTRYASCSASAPREPVTRAVAPAPP